MNMLEKFGWFLVAAGLLISTAALSYSIGVDKVRHEAISLGHAQYNPTNATFEWKPIKP